MWPSLQKSWPPSCLQRLLGGRSGAAEKCAQCDNMAVVYAVNKKSARNPILLRLLCLFCAIYDITLVARHLPGASNAAADALSRDNLPLFMSLNPQASIVISAALQHLLFNEQISMNSLTWTTRLRDTLEAASLAPLAQHMPAPCEGTSASASSSTWSANSH